MLLGFIIIGDTILERNNHPFSKQSLLKKQQYGTQSIIIAYLLIDGDIHREPPHVTYFFNNW